MPLLNLDINQCPHKFYEPNAFKGTHKCDQRSSYVRQFINFYLNYFLLFIVQQIQNNCIKYSYKTKLNQIEVFSVFGISINFLQTII